MEVFLNKKTQTLLNIGIIFLIVSMIGISSIVAESQQTNVSQVQPAVTLADLKINDKCIEYTSRTVNKRYGSMYCQVLIFEFIHTNREFWITDLTVNSWKGADPNAEYNWWSFYDIINNQHTTSTLKFQDNNQNMCYISPENEKTSGNDETVTFTIDGSSGVAWAVNYPEFAQCKIDRTNSLSIISVFHKLPPFLWVYRIYFYFLNCIFINSICNRKMEVQQ